MISIVNNNDYWAYGKLKRQEYNTLEGKLCSDIYHVYGTDLGSIIHYITITINIIALHYNYRCFDNVMNYITFTSQSNTITLQLL